MQKQLLTHISVCWTQLIIVAKKRNVSQQEQVGLDWQVFRAYDPKRALYVKSVPTQRLSLLVWVFSKERSAVIQWLHKVDFWKQKQRWDSSTHEVTESWLHNNPCSDWQLQPDEY